SHPILAIPLDGHSHALVETPRRGIPRFPPGSSGGGRAANGVMTVGRWVRSIAQSPCQSTLWSIARVSGIGSAKKEKFLLGPPWARVDCRGSLPSGQAALGRLFPTLGADPRMGPRNCPADGTCLASPRARLFCSLH